MDDDHPVPIHEPLTGPKFRELQSFWYRKKYLLLDEVSMVSSDMLNYIDQRLQELKGNNKPFGGISVICFGDLYQLPPPGKYARPVYGRVSNAGDATSTWKSHFVQVLRRKY